MTLFQTLGPITAPDIGLAIAIGIALPLYTWVEHIRDQRRDAQGRSRPLLQRYRQTMLMLWSATALVLVAWIGAGRPLADLGLRVGDDLWFIAALGAAALGGLLYGSQVFALRASAKDRAALRRMLAQQPGVDTAMPKTAAEMRSFRLVALTAGITEEILFRGFLIWALAHWMPLWGAVALALAIFTLAHLYQETARALAGVAFAGAVMTVLVLLSGSLLPAIILHAAIDLAGGEMVWTARRDEDEPDA